MSNPRQKARDLIELASDINNEDKERVSAAMKAVALIRKYNLLASPLDSLMDSDNETVQAASEIFSVLTDPKVTGNLKKLGAKFKGGLRRQRG